MTGIDDGAKVPAESKHQKAKHWLLIPPVNTKPTLWLLNAWEMRTKIQYTGIPPKIESLLLQNVSWFKRNG